jgi:hypothetical protein
LTSIKKELEQTKMNITALTHYINAKRKDEDRRKEEARNKAEKGQSSKGLFPPAS